MGFIVINFSGFHGLMQESEEFQTNSGRKEGKSEPKKDPHGPHADKFSCSAFVFETRRIC